ncbi:MAG: M20/M25/M40 family metallo-hydrolase [Clostridia bacterium]
MKRFWGKACLMVILIAALGVAAQAQDFEVDVGRIREATEYLSNEIGIRETGTAQERAACDWLEGQVRAMGFCAPDTLERTAFQGFKHLSSENLVARINPGAPALISVVAHYDSVPTSPGARDNAASVAILLELARYLEAHAADFPAEIRLVFLGSEENGYHGSRAYVERLSAQERARHVAAFNMDISISSKGLDAQLVANILGGKLPDGTYAEAMLMEPMENAATRAIERASQALYGTSVPVFYYGESDHYSFHNAELDAANICFRQIEAGSLRLPDEYHKMSDTPENLDYHTAEITARCVLKAIALLLDAPGALAAQ